MSAYDRFLQIEEIEAHLRLTSESRALVRQNPSEVDQLRAWAKIQRCEVRMIGLGLVDLVTPLVKKGVK